MNQETTEALVRLAEMFRAYRIDAGSEERLQAGIADVLETEKILFVREMSARGYRDRLDFFLTKHKIGLEVKVDGAQTAVVRQLMKYAEWECVEGLFLFTTRSKHIGIPVVLRHKPVQLYFQGGV